LYQETPKKGGDKEASGKLAGASAASQTCSGSELQIDNNVN